MQCQKYTNKDQEDYKLLNKSINLVKDVNINNNQSMMNQSELNMKQYLHKCFGHQVNILLPSRKFLQQLNNCYLIDVNTASVKDICIFLFNDALLIAQEFFTSGRHEYINSIVFDELSYCYGKHDLKYY